MANKQDIQEIDISWLQPNPLQPRGLIHPESITDLIESISEHGLIEPLVVAHTPAGYLIIAGERRWRACKAAGLTKVPCVVKEVNPQQMLEMAIVENVQREDLNSLERARAFERLMDEFKLNRDEVAKRVGKSPAYVSNTIRLLELPDVLKDGLLAGTITEGHARALQGLRDKGLMIEAYKIILRESASVRRAEDIVRRIKSKVDEAKKALLPKPQDTAYVGHRYLDEMQETMTKTLGERSKIKLFQSERQTKIMIILSGTPKVTAENLAKIYKGVTGMEIPKE